VLTAYRRLKSVGAVATVGVEVDGPPVDEVVAGAALVLVLVDGGDEVDDDVGVARAVFLSASPPLSERTDVDATATPAPSTTIAATAAMVRRWRFRCRARRASDRVVAGIDTDRTVARPRR
jgi:hypothetical protein